MMEFIVVFRIDEGDGYLRKRERIDAANPLQAINEVLEKWDRVEYIGSIEVVVATDEEEEDVMAGTSIQPRDFKREITVEIGK